MTVRAVAAITTVLCSMAFSACGQDDHTTTVVLKAPVASAAVRAEDQAKRGDADAKSHARDAVSQMESCLVEDELSVCARNSDVTSLATASGADASNYVLTASSDTGNTFTIAKTGGEYQRTCTGSSGGCQAGEW